MKFSLFLWDVLNFMDELICNAYAIVCFAYAIQVGCIIMQYGWVATMERLVFLGFRELKRLKSIYLFYVNIKVSILSSEIRLQLSDIDL